MIRNGAVTHTKQQLGSVSIARVLDAATRPPVFQMDHAPDVTLLAFALGGLVLDGGGLLALSLVLLAGYGFHASRSVFPLLRLSLLRIRTFRAAVSASVIN